MRIIAIDFDGTLCKSAYPAIGKPCKRVIHKAKRAQKRGDILILWTCREGEMLDKALAWCEEQGLHFDYANENTQGQMMLYGNDCRKIGADIYVDDKARWIRW